MAETQSLLTQWNWSSVDFRELAARIVLDPFSGSATCVRLHGPSVYIPSQFTLPLALSLHELSTNATKYGALACATGRVDMRWGLSETGRELLVTWNESGGPPVEADPKAGLRHANYQERILVWRCEAGLPQGLPRLRDQSAIAVVGGNPSWRVLATILSLTSRRARRPVSTGHSGSPLANLGLSSLDVCSWHPTEVVDLVELRPELRGQQTCPRGGRDDRR